MRQSLSAGSGMGSPATHQQEMIAKRFSEIHYDYVQEFKATSVRSNTPTCCPMSPDVNNVL
jgi:hypothetical protein